MSRGMCLYLGACLPLSLIVCTAMACGSIVGIVGGLAMLAVTAVGYVFAECIPQKEGNAEVADSKGRVGFKGRAG